MEQFFPPWLFLTAYVTLCFLPLTLAYVIVVQRAMDVRVVVRQGLQYALARGGILVLRFAIAAVLFYVVYSLVRHVGGGTLSSYSVIAVGLALLFGLRRLSERLMRWTDRRFFRDAYRAEQILADLSENLRGIVETHSLLQTISERIAASLHVPQVAVLIGSGPYQPAYAVGYPSTLEVTFPEDSGTVRRLREEREPERVYLDDPNSWVYRAPRVSEDERAKLAALRAELLLPVSVKDKLLGFISLSQKRSEEPYSGTDLRLLKSVAALLRRPSSARYVTSKGSCRAAAIWMSRAISVRLFFPAQAASPVSSGRDSRQTSLFQRLSSRGQRFLRVNNRIHLSATHTLAP